MNLKSNRCVNPTGKVRVRGQLLFVEIDSGMAALRAIQLLGNGIAIYRLCRNASDVLHPVGMGQHLLPEKYDTIDGDGPCRFGDE
jgi:hypothetical protein